MLMTLHVCSRASACVTVSVECQHTRLEDDKQA